MTTTLVNLCQCSVTCTVNTCFLLFRGNFHGQVLSIYSCLRTVHYRIEPISIFFAHLLQIFDKIPLESLLQDEQPQLYEILQAESPNHKHTLTLYLCPCLHQPSIMLDLLTADSQLLQPTTSVSNTNWEFMTTNLMISGESNSKHNTFTYTFLNPYPDKVVS